MDKKVLKTNEMFVGIINDATQIIAVAREAMGLRQCAKQNALVHKIAELTENIDNAYSSNWH